MSKVFLAAGHGGTDPGAVGNGTNERDLTIQLINDAVGLLTTQDMKGRQVVVVPHWMNLVDEINWINQQSNDPEHDICIEVHLNAGGGKGIEVWYYSGIQVSMDFANELLTPLVSVTGLPSRGVKGDATNRWGSLGFIRDTAPLAALIEFGFVDNANDVAVVKEKGALALASAVLNASGSVYKVAAPVIPVPPTPVTPIETPTVPPKLPDPVPVPLTPEKVDISALNKLINYLVELFKRIFGGK